MKTVKRRIFRNKTQKFLYNSRNPDKSFDVYIDKDPSDTIPIKYTTLGNVKQTIRTLESLYKSKQYPHKRIWQVGMIMKVRLNVLKSKKLAEYKLAERYFMFLKKRTSMPDEQRYKMTFIF